MRIDCTFTFGVDETEPSVLVPCAIEPDSSTIATIST